MLAWSVVRLVKAVKNAMPMRIDLITIRPVHPHGCVERYRTGNMKNYVASFLFKSSGQIAAQLSGRKSFLETFPPVNFSMRTHRSSEIAVEPETICDMYEIETSRNSAISFCFPRPSFKKYSFNCIGI